MPELILSRRRRDLRCHLDHRHIAHRDEVESESLAGPEPGRADDLDLGQLLVHGAHAVDRLAAEHHMTSEFADFGFAGLRDQANLSTARGPDRSAR
jgi:hypothetical protein